MILEWLFASVIGILKTLFFIIPDLPSLPDFLINSLENFTNLIFDNVELLCYFVSIPLIKALVPLIILVENFEHVYNFVIWIIRKIPISSE